MISQNSVLPSATQQSTWMQIADFLRTIGQFFVAFGTALTQIGQWIYGILFPQTY